jgi:uncharacterized membrane protein YheB (UPF0754 family)
MDYYRYILPPVVGAVIGWLTNYVAIKLLFRPHRPLNIFGLKLQGLIPKRRKEIARGMAKTIERELLSSKDLASALDAIDWKEEVEKTVEEVVEHRLTTSRLKKVPLIGLISENLNYHIKYLITKEILRQVDKKKESFAVRFKDRIDVKDMLASRIDKLDLFRFEELLTDFIGRELRHIEWLGGVMGFFIGLAQSVLIYFFW